MAHQQPKYITRSQLLAHFNISSTTFWRWVNDEDMGFPKALDFGDRRTKLWDMADINAFAAKCNPNQNQTSAAVSQAA